MALLPTPRRSKKVLESAIEYKRKGWQPLPVPFQSKNPGFSWNTFTANENELPLHFKESRQNIGVILGTRSNGLTDVDLDSPEAVKAADYFLPSTGAIFGRASKPRSHRIYISDFPKIEKFSLSAKENIVEIRSNGGQTIFPPSVHEGGETIYWSLENEPAQVDGADLRRAVALLASACVLSKFFVRGARNQISLAIAGTLLNNGFDLSEVKNFVSAISFLTGDEESSDRINAVIATERKLRNKELVTGFPELKRLTDDKAAETIYAWLKIDEYKQSQYPPVYIGSNNGSGASAWVAGEPPATAQSDFANLPKPLDSVLKPVKEINENSLPDVLKDWLRPASAVIGCPFGFLVLSAIVEAGSLIGSRLRLKPLQNSDWFVVPNLYAGLVGTPSTKKTPALDEARKPILKLQAKSRHDFKIAKADYELESKLYERHTNNIIKKFTGNNAAAIKTQIASLNKPVEPVYKRFETNDVTTAKLIQLLGINPNGFLLFRDELAGWLQSFESEYEKTSRAFILELWKGAIAYELGRISDGREDQLESGTLSIIGGIQPSKLQRYVAEAYSFNNSDGFLQRFLFCYPDVSRPHKTPSRIDYEEMQAGFKKADRIFERLANFDFHGKCVGPNNDVFYVVKFDSEAQKIADEWISDTELEAEYLQHEDEAFSNYLYKISKSCFSIALIFHCFENIDADIFPDEISKITILKAITYTDVLISHARRVFALGENRVFALANSFLGKIKKGDLKQGFTRREVTRKGWSALNKAEIVQDVLDLLVDYDYLVEKQFTGPHRHKVEYYFHPSLEKEINDETNEDELDD